MFANTRTRIALGLKRTWRGGGGDVRTGAGEGGSALSEYEMHLTCWLPGRPVRLIYLIQFGL